MRAVVKVAGPVLLALLFAAGAFAQEPLTWGDMQAEVRERSSEGEAIRDPYGGEADQYGELTLPPGPGPHPVVVVLHGGCWLSIADLAYMRPFTRALNEAGWATWNLEFRRIDQEGGAWPAILQDVARGTDHLRDLGERYPLDLDRVLAAGHSSGGHLALWLASRHRIPRESRWGDAVGGGEPFPLRGAAALAPIAALDDFQARSDRCGGTIVQDFLGAAGEEARARRAVSDPPALLPTEVPQLLIMGERDDIVPVGHGQAYQSMAAARGQPVALEVVEGAGHFEVVAPWTRPWEGVLERLLGFAEQVAGGA